jgi:hypothetical protein
MCWLEMQGVSRPRLGLLHVCVAAAIANTKTETRTATTGRRQHAAHQRCGDANPYFLFLQTMHKEIYEMYL